MKSAEFINQLIEQNNLKNDSAASKFLNWSSGQMSQYRTGKRIMDNEAAIQLAIALNINPLAVIMAADIDRAQKAGKSSAWEKLIVINKLTDVPLHLAANQSVKVNAEPSDIYIMSN